MKKLTAIVFVSLAFNCLQAQEDSVISPKKKVPNVATLKMLNGTVKKGWFYQMSDSGIALLEMKGQYKKTVNIINADKNAPTHNINIEQIKYLTLQKKNSAMKGLLIGLGSGIVTGAVLGFASGDDYVAPYTNSFGDIFIAIGNAFAMTAGEKALFGAIGLGTLGAITGVVIGTITKRKFIINGNKKRIRELDGELRKRLLVQ